jgi:hypothetical protein
MFLFVLFGGSRLSWEGARKERQHDALHLQIPESFLATFLIVIDFTSFQNPTGIALKKIRVV